MRVLLYTPMHRAIPEAAASWERAILKTRADFPAIQLDHLRGYGHPLHLTIGPYIIVHKQNEARQFALSGGYHALLSIEDDMLIPENGIAGLLALLDEGVDIAYGLYVWRRAPHKWNAYSKVAANGGRSVCEDDGWRDLWDQPIEVQGVGLGFTAIKADALEALTFQRRDGVDADWRLAIDAQRGGLIQVCHTGIRCGHSTPEGVYWPDNGVDYWRLEPCAS